MSKKVTMIDKMTGTICNMQMAAKKVHETNNLSDVGRLRRLFDVGGVETDFKLESTFEQNKS